MSHNTPHFLLLSQAEISDQRTRSGRWKFHLESIDGNSVIEASDDEPFEGERLHLMAVVRGLEALDQPSTVTLLTDSRQITRGFRFGLSNWRTNGWKWERFGELTPVNNHDLWQRVDHALQFHHVNCRTWRIDRAHHESHTNPKTSTRAKIGTLVRTLISRITRWSLGDPSLGSRIRGNAA